MDHNKTIVSSFDPNQTAAMPSGGDRSGTDVASGAFLVRFISRASAF